MKKNMLVAVIVVAALSLLTAGVALAQEPTPPAPAGFGMGPGMMGRFANSDGEYGPMHEYMQKALADALGISVDEFETQREAGETPYQIAIDLGFKADEIPTLLRDARLKGLEAAAAAGVIPQEMVERMKTRLENANPGAGDCPGFRQGFIRGMMRGWRLQQSNPQ